MSGHGNLVAFAILAAAAVYLVITYARDRARRLRIERRLKDG